MERIVVHDSQPLERVPDSQHPSSVLRQPLTQDMRVSLFALVVLLQSLVELVSEIENSIVPMRMQQELLRRQEFLSRPHGNDRPHVIAINHASRSMRSWSIFLQQILTLFRLAILSLTNAPMRRINCPWYIKPRTIEWFYLYIDWIPDQDPERFRQFFRISPQLFHEICGLVRVDMTSHTPHCFPSLPNRFLLVERQVALALRRLSTGDGLLGIGELFGLSKPTASKVTWKFIQAFCHRGRGLLIWPEGPAMDEVQRGFHQVWGFPNCSGAIDVTHIQIELPVGENSVAYYDWKHKLSITMQAVVDIHCRFLDVVIGNPGSIQDSRVLRTSGLYHNVVYDNTKLNGAEFLTPQGYRLGEYLLGDAGYPLFKWIIVPFPHGLSEATDRWNRQHSSARMCVERAFGRLKGMWRLLSRVIVRPKLDRLAPIVLCCVLLHNLMIHRGEDVAAQVWNDIPAHPQGYENQHRRNREMFEGGQQAQEALVRNVNARHF